MLARPTAPRANLGRNVLSARPTSDTTCRGSAAENASRQRPATAPFFASRFTCTSNVSILSLAAATSDALVKLRAAGVAVDREALNVAQPQITAEEPSFQAFWDATSRE